MILLTGWLIDGSGRKAQGGVFLEIRGGVIQRLGNVPADGSLPAGRLVDFSGCTMIPGLVDSHVHLCFSGDSDPDRRARRRDAGYEKARGVLAGHLDDHRRHGIWGVRDGGDHHGHTLRYKREEPLSDLPARVAAAGRAWHRSGRYGRLIGRCQEAGSTLAQAIAAEPEGADHVKIVNSGLNSLEVYGRETAPQFTLAMLREAVAAADSKGLGTMVHANGREPVAMALEAGCRSIEHGFFMGRENLRRLADRQVAWVPTAVTMQAYAELRQSEGLETGVVRRTLESQLEQIRLAHEFGVRLAIGTDAGSPGVSHGEAIVAEMTLFMQAGLTIEEVIACGSVNGAELMGAADSGLLVAGRPATFAVVPGSPEKLPDSLRRLRAFYLNGEALSVRAACNQSPAC